MKAARSAASTATCRRSATRCRREDIALAVGHVRTFCKEPAWPRGDLNLPRAFFTEKAFPENESVWATTFTRRGDALRRQRADLRTPARGEEPDRSERADHVSSRMPRVEWNRGLGDVAFAFKRTVYASMRTGGIGAAGMEVILPTGKEELGLGNGYTVFEPFAMWGQILPRNSFLQLHGGVELPSDSTKGAREAYLRTAVGTTFAQNSGFGRAWSPQVEVLWARPQDGAVGVGRRAAGAGHAVEAPARHGRRRHPDSRHSARGPAEAGPGLSALGLVRRRLLRVLEMSGVTRPVLFAASVWLCALLCRRRRAPTRRSRPATNQPPMRRRAAARLDVRAVERLRRVPQQPRHAGRRGCLDRRELAGHHDGELRARSVRPGQRAARDDRPRGACRRHRGRVRDLPPAGRAEDRARGRREGASSSRIWRTPRPATRTALDDAGASTVCRARSATRSPPIGLARGRASTATSSSPHHARRQAPRLRPVRC